MEDMEDDGIVRSLAYSQFMDELEAFHKALGTTLQREPVLGGKKLDLYRMFQWVQEAGGFHKVTDDRGWKRITSPMNLPSTCTSAAYVAKLVYRTSLYYWELHKSQNLSIDEVKRRMLEDESENPAAKSPGRSPGDRSVEPTSKRARQDQPTALNRSSRGAGPFYRPAMPPYAYQAPQTQAPSLPPPLVPPAAPPRTVFATPFRDDAQDEKFLTGGPRNRLLLALQSGLPNEIDWAFNKLVKLSKICPDNFDVSSIPGLLGTIASFAEPFFSQLKLNTSLENFETTLEVQGWTLQKDGSLSKMPVFEELSVFNMEEADQLLERVLQVMHILRNFSHLPHHAKAFLSEQSILTLLAKALALPLYSSYIEVKRHSLDIFENLAASITVRGKNDFYLACVKKMLFDKDRSLVIGALRSISRLCNAESNNPVMADADPIMLNRLFQLMLVPNDEEVVYAVLDVIYMISCFGSDASSKIAACVPSNVVKLLLAFLQVKYGHGKQRYEPEVLQEPKKPLKRKLPVVFKPPPPPPREPSPPENVPIPQSSSDQLTESAAVTPEDCAKSWVIRHMILDEHAEIDLNTILREANLAIVGRNIKGTVTTDKLRQVLLEQFPGIDVPLEGSVKGLKMQSTNDERSKGDDELQVLSDAATLSILDDLLRDPLLQTSSDPSSSNFSANTERSDDVHASGAVNQDEPKQISAETRKPEDMVKQPLPEFGTPVEKSAGTPLPVSSPPKEAMEQSDKQASDHPRPSAAAEFPAVAANASAPGSTTAAVEVDPEEEDEVLEEGDVEHSSIIPMETAEAAGQPARTPGDGNSSPTAFHSSQPATFGVNQPNTQSVAGVLKNVPQQTPLYGSVQVSTNSAVPAPPRKRGRPRKAEGSSTPLQNPQQQSDPLFQQQQQALIMQQHQQQQWNAMMQQAQHRMDLERRMSQDQAARNNVRLSSDAMDVDGTNPSSTIDRSPQTPCLWGTVMTGDDGNQFLEVSCDFRAASQQELLHHVQTAHSDGSNSFQCSWAGCTALAGKSLTLEHGMRHFVTHLPRTDVSTSNASAGTDSGLSKAVPPSSRSAPDVSTDLRGTPLTVLLVLRNLARVPKNRELFVAYEIDLMILMAERPKLAKMIGDILWELK